ncbi:PREDICTED: uncharacterized protein LOC104608804 [Nelumbo nucifera]|uniref:Uncharacterized protein LOC104608804 n=1 Tax=Nelumbo nucifera TaxID=4432 RepID=A0A1U8AY10_NELNU|nr:PREDICTED: uncharacterized protein LOC104608804 [Nelumbo nucifera]
MAPFIDDEEAWRCRKHPSKRPTTGVCPFCLRDRLITLCPECANVRPCACYPTSSSSSSSSSSLFSRSSSKSNTGIGATGRMSNLIDSECPFRRSRSTSLPFFRRRMDKKDDETGNPPPRHGSRTSLWSIIKAKRGKKSKKPEEVKEVKDEDEAKKKMTRSKSVPFPSYSSSGGNEKLKAKSWHFPSPMKVFRHQKTPKVAREGPPLSRVLSKSN